VAVAAELGDAGDAVRAADAVDTDRLPEGLVSRRAQVHLDVAWAQAQRKRDAEATLHLLEVERIAPEVIGHHVIAKRWCARCSPGTASADQRPSDLARRAGLLE
jgi:hypothetical protein